MSTLNIAPLFPVAKRERELKDIFDYIDATESTRKDYKARIGDFIEFTATNGINVNILLEYKNHLNNRLDLAVASKNKYLAVAKIYLRQLYKNGVLPRDITINVKQFKQTKSHKKFGHTKEEVQMILEHIQKLPLRDKAMMYVLFFQGLRQVELVRLETQDIDFTNNTALIRGKGRDDKEVIHLHPKVAEVLKEYCRFRPSQSRVFPLTERMVRIIYDKIADALGIEKTLHGSRKFFVTEMLKALDGNLDEARKYSRHNSYDMLIIYNDNIDMDKTLPTFHKTFDDIENGR